MIKLKVVSTIREAKGDSKDLVKINADKIRATKEKPVDKSQIRDFEMSVKADAEQGIEPSIFSRQIINYIEDMPEESLPQIGRRYFVKWLANVILTTGRKPDTQAINFIRDYYVGNNAQELPDSLQATLQAAQEWHENLHKDENVDLGDYKTNDVVHDFGNGYKMVRIASTSGVKEDVDYDLKLEGKKMGNCIGTLHCHNILSSEETIYSLRDSENEPHVSINHWKESDRIDEIKGKQNKEPIKKYLDIVIPWIKENFTVKQYLYAQNGLITRDLSDEQVKDHVFNDDSIDYESVRFLANRIYEQNKDKYINNIYKLFSESIKKCNNTLPIYLYYELIDIVPKNKSELDGMISQFFNKILSSNNVKNIYQLYRSAWHGESFGISKETTDSNYLDNFLYKKIIIKFLSIIRHFINKGNLDYLRVILEDRYRLPDYAKHWIQKLIFEKISKIISIPINSIDDIKNILATISTASRYNNFNSENEELKNAFLKVLKIIEENGYDYEDIVKKDSNLDVRRYLHMQLSELKYRFQQLANI